MPISDHPGHFEDSLDYLVVLVYIAGISFFIFHYRLLWFLFFHLSSYYGVLNTLPYIGPVPARYLRHVFLCPSSDSLV